MSLSHLLRDRNTLVRQFVDRHFTFQPLSRDINKRLKQLPAVFWPPYRDTYHFMLAGTAADIMIGGLFDQALHRRSAVETGLEMLGSNGLSFGLEGMKPTVSTWSNGRAIWDETVGFHAELTQLGA